VSPFRSEAGEVVAAEFLILHRFLFVIDLLLGFEERVREISLVFIHTSKIARANSAGS